MYCKHCGKIIDNDSVFCCECGGKVTPYNEHNNQSRKVSNSDNNGKKIVRNGETYTIRDGVLFDEDGWDVGRLPHGYIHGYGDTV